MHRNMESRRHVPGTDTVLPVNYTSKTHSKKKGSQLGDQSGLREQGELDEVSRKVQMSSFKTNNY